MQQLILLVLLNIISVVCFAQNYKTTGKIIINDKELNNLIDTATGIEIIAEGFNWPEGPLWLAADNKLIFSDVPENVIFEWTESQGIQIYLRTSGYTGDTQRGGEMGSNGLLLSPEGDLVLCQHGDRRIARMKTSPTSPESKFETLAHKYEGKRLNSPNDAVYSKSEELYFTDPPYGLEKKMDDSAKELNFQGVFKISKNGTVQLLTNELECPNGIAFSPDYSKLYVANSDPNYAIWMVYDVKKDGTLENGKVFYDATDLAHKEKGLPDGMKVHMNGTVFATGPGGIFIFSGDGKILGRIKTGQETSNCAFNDDYSALYITADNYILRVRLKNEGQ
ncbi:SMP-30/gluconolactonase/LRE family protein [Maribellus sediminis]|uniref:SMP-30/gluconolactonase/LRE family protein n=1 Tax=Maribellus sediminis TaxID=2696285 RepID=UPI00142FA5ED|nr:SMP-30/gluconolactonase/LRE family protein [Maribellus sediminis]